MIIGCLSSISPFKEYHSMHTCNSGCHGNPNEKLNMLGTASKKIRWGYQKFWLQILVKIRKWGEEAL